MLTAIKQIWTTAPIDLADPAGVWATAIESLTAQQVKHGIHELSFMTSAFPPVPGVFRESCVRYQAFEPSNKLLSRPSSSVRSDALLVCRAYLHRRLSGDRFPFQANVQAPDDFDVHGVVWSVTVAKQPGSFVGKLDRNIAAYNELSRIFNEEWDRYERERQTA